MKRERVKFFVVSTKNTKVFFAKRDLRGRLGVLADMGFARQASRSRRHECALLAGVFDGRGGVQMASYSLRYSNGFVWMNTLIEDACFARFSGA